MALQQHFSSSRIPNLKIEHIDSPVMHSASGNQVLSAKLFGEVCRILGREVAESLIGSHSSIDLLNTKTIVSRDLPKAMDMNLLPPDVQEAYKKFASMPGSQDEWKALGRPQGGWNGKNFRVEGINHDDGEQTSTIILSSCPNKLLQAEKDVRAASTERRPWGAQQTHVGLLAFTEINGEKFLVAQLRGAWVDQGGTVHPNIIAGGLEERSFGKERDPIAETLRFERLEEMGAKDFGWQVSAPLYLLNEDGYSTVHPEGGSALYCNFAHTMCGQDGGVIPFEEYLQMFKNYSEILKAKNETMATREVVGWALIPLDAPQLSVEEGKIFVHNLKTFETNVEGGVTESHIAHIEGFSLGAFAPFVQLVADSDLRHVVLTNAGFKE